jgi:citrate synthase
MNDMEVAVERIEKAIKKNEKILVYGDYDVDGTTAVALVYTFLKSFYPNVDFYSGILLRAIGIPMNMFTVMFAIGRMPGWMAHWKELLDQNQRISRPRQIYMGCANCHYVPMEER